jgi:hypothetical protein
MGPAQVTYMEIVCCNGEDQCVKLLHMGWRCQVAVKCGSKPVMGIALATCLEIACCHGQMGDVLYMQGWDM